MTPVTNGLSRKRSSRLASGTITGCPAWSTTLHMESSRAHTEASKPTAATWTCSVSVIRLMVAIGTRATWAATSTSATRSGRGGSQSTR